MYIAEVLSSQGPALLEKLQEVGFTSEQAQQFLPEVEQQLANAFTGGGFAGLLGGRGAEGSPLDRVDVAGIASTLGIDGDLVGNGLQAIVAQVGDSLKGNAGSLLGGIGSKLLG